MKVKRKLSRKGNGMSMQTTLSHKYSPTDRWIDRNIRYCTENGIFLGSLSHRVGAIKDFKLCFSLHDRDMDRRKVKEVITAYLKESFNAVNLRFFLADASNGYVHFDCGKDQDWPSTKPPLPVIRG